MKQFILLSCLQTLLGLWFSCTALSPTDPSPSLLMSSPGEALDSLCRQSIAGDELLAAKEARIKLCECLGEKLPEFGKKMCDPGGDLDRWSDHLVGELQANRPQDFTNLKCLGSLEQLNLERFYDDLNAACDAGHYDLRSLVTYPFREQTESSCYRVTRMTADGCLEAGRCETSDSLKSLQTANGLDFSPGVHKIKACNATLTAAHRLKDPGEEALSFNFPYVLAYALGRISATGSFGAANCHGTAQLIGGDFLRHTQLESIRYQRLQDKPKCRHLAEELMTSKTPPLVRDLNLNPGGFLINMRYEACSERECGKAQLWVEGCDDTKLRSLAFVEGMCIHCWSAKLKAAGYQQVNSHERWQDTLKPGCVLTAQDHSVVVVGQSATMCYYYEATTPYGPPQLGVLPCPQMFAKFPLRYCPQAPMMFESTPLLE